jgi:hypothetical protein
LAGGNRRDTESLCEFHEVQPVDVSEGQHLATGMRQRRERDSGYFGIENSECELLRSRFRRSQMLRGVRAY